MLPHNNISNLILRNSKTYSIEETRLTKLLFDSKKVGVTWHTGFQDKLIVDDLTIKQDILTKKVSESKYDRLVIPVYFLKAYFSNSQIIRGVIRPRVTMKDDRLIVLPSYSTLPSELHFYYGEVDWEVCGKTTTLRNNMLEAKTFEKEIYVNDIGPDFEVELPKDKKLLKTIYFTALS
ncbi:MAG: hypothetical protein ISS25_02785 [Nanoarchaeota archaeon]|nr:hypothetical protein [DPANN group archaeon]MBL7116729.1 hypothetical protein [Nanoarchaeota archaeon]